MSGGVNCGSTGVDVLYECGMNEKKHRPKNRYYRAKREVCPSSAGAISLGELEVWEMTAPGMD